ncbi:MAG: ion channel [Colwellia sp.]
MNKNKHLCRYCDPQIKSNHNFSHAAIETALLCCPNEANDSGFCYWHDKSENKSGKEVKSKLEQYAQNNGFLRGICLSKADLKGIDLVNHHQTSGYDFSYADFYHAELKEAHLFNINLNHASLMKADLRNANLNCANLENTNLLGVKWSGGKFENITIGKQIRQEIEAKQALKQGDSLQSKDLTEQAEEIYRNLRKHAEQEGIFTLSGFFIHKELTMRRLQLPRYSMQRFLSKMVDIFCGYGEAPLRIVGLSIAIIMVCAILYAFTGLNYQDTIHQVSSQHSFAENVSFFLSSLYFSVVTFTTLGYGDFNPVGVSRAIAAIEAFTGSFTIALFVVVFVKKMTR